MANKQYWKPEDVKLDNLVLAITPDAACAPGKTWQGRRMPGQRLPAPLRYREVMKQDPICACCNKPGSTWASLAYNVTHPPLDQLKVRQALDMAIDKPAIIKAVYQSAGDWRRTHCHRRSGLMTPPSRTPLTIPPKPRRYLKKQGLHPVPPSTYGR